jgi:hypothetical protein
MRSWHIVAAGVIAGSIATGGLFAPEIIAFRTDLAGLFTARWQIFATVWLSAYGVTALVAATACFLATIGQTLRQITDTEGGESAARVTQAIVLPYSAGRYVVQLATTQYFTAVVALFGLGVWQSVASVPPAGLTLRAIAATDPVRAGGLVLLIGLFGFFAVTGAAVWGKGKIRRVVAGSAEQRLLREVVELLKARPAAPAEPAISDAAQLGALIEQGQRAVLEAITSLTTAVNQLSRGLRRTLGEIKDALREDGGAASAGSVAHPLAIEGVTAELQAVVTSLTAAVASLGEMASLLTARQTPAGVQPPAIPVSQLSTELENLMREIETGAAGGQDASRP